MEKLLPDRPSLRYIEKTLTLLESEEGPDEEKINWKDLYEKVGPWDSGLELSENIRIIVREYVLSKFPRLKERIPSIENLPDREMLNALANGWFEELGKEVEGTRRQVLLAVLAHLTKRIETRIYKKIIESASEEELTKLGLKDNMGRLLIDCLDAAVRSDPMFIRFLAYSHLSPKPPKDAIESAPVDQHGQPRTWADLFPHEAQFISAKIKKILEAQEAWLEEKGGKEFADYLQLLSDFFSEKNPEKSHEILKKVEIAYARSIEADFPIQIAPPTGVYYKEPYVDPELRVLLHTPEARDKEAGFRRLQQALVDELGSLDLEGFAEEISNRIPRSYISISAYGASLTFTAAAETDKTTTLFLDEQIRHYDKNLKEFTSLIEMGGLTFLKSNRNE